MKHRIPLTVLVLVVLPHTMSAQDLDPLFNVGTGANGRVATSVMQPDGRAIIGGSFTTYNAASAVRVVRINVDGTLDATFNVGTGAPAPVNDLALAADGKVYAAGNFTTFNGIARPRIVRLGTDGSVDAAFDPGTGFNGLVTQVLVQPDGRVVCTGNFTTYNGTGRNRVARLHADGTLDASFDPGTGANFLVTSLDRQADGKLLIGGFFNDYDGTLAIGLARLHADGSLDVTYNSGGSGLDNAVSTITIMPDGKAMVGGVFTAYNGVGRNRIMRLNTDGTLDASFDPGGGASNDVLAIARQADGRLVVGGVFTAFNGAGHDRICRLMPNGVLDPTWTTGAGDALNTLQLVAGDRVLIGGIFTSYDGTPINRLARLKESCTNDLVLEVQNDANGAETAWAIEPVGGGAALCGGSGLPDNAVATLNCCLPDGCYRLVVTDAGGDGIAGGGYVLRTVDGDRIIDNTGNFTSGGTSSVADGFCLPLGDDRPIHTSCDRTWWQGGNYLVAAENPAVSAEFGVSNATSGYEFWFFDPNGGLSFRKFRDHATSDGFAPNNAVRAAHIKLNNWAAAQHLQNNVLYNVRIRGVIDGMELPFGPACRTMLDPVAAACTPTGLNDITGHPNFSCGVSRTWGGPNSAANRVYARSVGGADKYEFEFSNPGEGYLVAMQSNTVVRHLNWSSQPALNVGSIYQVRVRASKDGGATWCGWGWTCDVTVAPGVAPEGESFAALGQTGVSLWPNPNNGQQLWLAVEGLADEVRTITVDIHDLSGKRVAAHQVPSRSGAMEVALNGMAAGTYVVTITAGDQRHVERLVITE